MVKKLKYIWTNSQLQKEWGKFYIEPKLSDTKLSENIRILLSEFLSERNIISQVWNNEDMTYSFDFDSEESMVKFIMEYL